MRAHRGTVADKLGERGQTVILRVVGSRRAGDRPYLRIELPGVEPREAIATVDHANALRGLARAIMRSLERETRGGTDGE